MGLCLSPEKVQCPQRLPLVFLNWGHFCPSPFPRDSRQYPETFLMVTPGGEDGATGMSRQRPDRTLLDSLQRTGQPHGTE